MNANPYEAPHSTPSTLKRRPAWMVLAAAGYFTVTLACGYMAVRCVMEGYGLIGYEITSSVPIRLLGRRVTATDFFLAIGALLAIVSLFFAFLAFHQARSWSASASNPNRPYVSHRGMSRHP